MPHKLNAFKEIVIKTIGKRKLESEGDVKFFANKDIFLRGNEDSIQKLADIMHKFNSSVLGDKEVVVKYAKELIESASPKYPLLAHSAKPVRPHVSLVHSAKSYVESSTVDDMHNINNMKRLTKKRSSSPQSSVALSSAIPNKRHTERLNQRRSNTKDNASIINK